MSFKQKTISGFTWSFGASWLNFGIGFVFSIVLARLLSPVEFGLMAMAYVFINLSNLFVNLGFSGSIIQRKEIDNKDTSTIFWFVLFLAIIITLFLNAFAGLIARFYNEQTVKGIIHALSLTFIIRSLGSMHSTLLTREIKFKQLSIISTVNILVNNIIATILAIYGFGVWALVIRELVKSVISVTSYWIVIPWKPNFYFSFSVLKSHARFGLSMFGNQLQAYSGRNADNLIIGKFLGDHALGIYKKAYSTLTFPIARVSDSLQKVLFPSFSSIQDDLDRIKRVFLKINRVVFMLVAPLMIIVGFYAKELVLVLFGQKWVEMIPVIRVFAFLAIWQSVIRLTGSTLLALGKSVLIFKLNLVQNTLLILVFLISALKGDLMTIVYAYTIAFIAITIPKQIYLLKYLEIRFLHYLYQFLKLSFPVLSMIGISIALRFFLDPLINGSDIWLLFIHVFSITIIYLVVVHAINISEYNELREYLSEKIRNFGKKGQ